VLDGGAAPPVVAGMAERTGQHGERLLAQADQQAATIAAAEDELTQLARTLLAGLTEGESR
jgi:hypothetical protein